MKTRFLLLATTLFLSFAGFGQVWSPQAAGTLPSNYSIMNISIVNEHVVWAVALDYNQWMSPVPATHLLKVLKTTNGGDTWTVKDFTEAPGRMTYGIYALDENTAFLGTSNFSNADELFKTTNGGNVWVQVFSGPAASGRALFFNDQEGVSISPGYGIARTNNGGGNWSNLTPNIDYPPFLSGEDHLNTPTNWSIVGDTIWIGTTKGRIYRSIDKGQSWTVHQATATNNAFVSTAFIDSKNGLGIVGNFNNPPLKLIKTTDGGANWVEISNSQNLTEIFVIPCTRTILGISYYDDITAWSKNLGSSWVALDNTIKGSGQAFYSPEIGWMTNGDVTGPNPALYKWSGDALYGRTFVNKNANGNNDGKTWADAYTDLQAALTAAEEGDEIWVAEGTYLPGTNSNATFSIDKNLKLYGGFAGSECSLSERDIVAHPTILSGDLEGDDILNNFTQNRSDNVLNVLRVNSNVTNETLLDGFTIRNGQADGGSGQAAGGGILCSGKPIIRQCIFEQNFSSETGGALSLSNTSNGVIVRGCHFNHNGSNSGGGIFIGGSPEYTIDSCTFSDNLSVTGVFESHGGGIYIVNGNGTILNCTFTGNTAIQAGAALFAWTTQSSTVASLEIVQCNFQFNNANSGGAIGLVPWGDNSHYSILDCNFEENEASTNGGSMYVGLNTSSNQAEVLLDNCHFSKNTAVNNGSAFYVGIAGKNADVELRNCQFNENTATNFSAAADFWGTDGGTGSVIVDSCIFKNNTSGYSGALEMGNGHNGGAYVDFTLTNSTFLNNQAMEGGAVILWSDALSTSNFTVENCHWEGNSASLKGGALMFNPNSNNYSAIVKRSTFLNNQSPDGSAINSYIFLPSSGSVFPANAKVSIENSLFAGNTGNNAVISTDSLANLHLLNCTIADNASNGIQLADQSGLTLQNTILANPGHTEYTAIGELTFTSNGGNLVLDNSLNAVLTAADKPETEPAFEPGTYEPSATSPLVNGGNNAGVTAEFDLAGNARIQGGTVDIGAYESGFTSAREVIIGTVNLSPNPATDFLNIHLPETITKPNEISVFDAQGRFLESQTFVAGQPLTVRHLSDGVYLVKLTDGERVYIGKFVKQ